MTKKIDDKFIQKISGKEFILYAGLVELGHQEGMNSIEIELLQIPNIDNDMTAIVKAIVKTKDKSFEDIGDASPKSVGNMIKPHIIRMAATRAKARALRDLTNVGMTAYEELGGDEDDKPSKSTNNYNKANTRKPSKPQSNLASEKQLNFVYKLVKDKEYGADNISKYIKDNYKKASSKELTKQEASELIEMLNNIGGNDNV